MSRKQEYDFVVTLKQPDYKIYNIISVLMCLMTVMASVAGLLHSLFTNFTWLNIFLDVYIIAHLIISFINSGKKDGIVKFSWALYASAFLWLLYPLHTPLITFFYVVAALLERQIKFSQEIGFSKERITFNTFPFKNYSWHQLKNVVLKDNVITLDFRNNKIIQKEIESVDLTEEEKEFNEFCKIQLVNKI